MFALKLIAIPYFFAFPIAVCAAGAPMTVDRGKRGLQVRGVGFDGRPITMPLVKVCMGLN